MTILITGGAGYIGRHTARLLAQCGQRFVVFDNLVTSDRTHTRLGPFPAPFHEGELEDRALLRRCLREQRVTAVLHLAASAHVGDSMAQPGAYFRNNVTASLSLLDAMVDEGVQELVFASSCSVYGRGEGDTAATAHEDHAVNPVSAYGESKLALERMLPAYAEAHGIRSMALRYFNAAGADSAREPAHPSSLRRIIPRALAAARGLAPPLEVYGLDHKTPDGSAIRDYVHVSDIARANLCALQSLRAAAVGPAAVGPGPVPRRNLTVLNIASGTGSSVLEIVAEVERQTGRPVARLLRERRPGDPSAVIADITRAHQVLGWTPVRSRLPSIIASALKALEAGAPTASSSGRKPYSYAQQRLSSP